METMDIIRVVMWIISLLLVPAFTILFNRVRALEIRMETRISHQDAATMIQDNRAAMDARFDRLESMLIEVIRENHHK